MPQHAKTIADTDRELLITIENVTFRYPSDSDGPDVIHDFCLSVRRGDVLAVRGRNGSGKTTLLRLIAGQLTPTSGTVVRHIAGLHTVYLNQHASDCVAPGLTVREQLLVGMGAHVCPFRLSTNRAVVADIEDRLSRYGIGLPDKVNTFTSVLSGGQRQVVALLSALCAQADVLLLDEYVSFMDDETASISRQLIQALVGSKNVSVIVVDHAEESFVPSENIISLGDHT